ncbi:hypothetical protein ACFO5O_00610 [Geojedonia litorea]|uniref:Uncharacterized protein n=1 Tax=Geojedonia litorea TaxID=1268269 RepID=A0ABV9N1E4_9FLAO
MQRFEAIILFYKPLFLWSFAANIAITLFNPLLFQAFIAKLFLTIFARYYVIQSDTKQKLTTFKSLGISEFKLFSFLYIIDVCIMSIYLVLIKEFI